MFKIYNLLQGVTFSTIFLIIGLLIGLSLQTTGFIQNTGSTFSTPIATDGYELPSNTISNSNPITGMITGIKSSFSGVPERASPSDRVPESAIAVYGNRVVLDIKNAQWSTFTDTNSMDPIIDKGANAIEIVPKSANDIKVGDIISYKSKYADGTIIHRVIAKGVDDKGTYFILKGDNLSTQDPGKIRFSQILRVLVAIIY